MRDKDLCPASVTNSKFFLITCDKNLTQSNGDSKNREIPMCGDFQLGIVLINGEFVYRKVVYTPLKRWCA